MKRLLSMIAVTALVVPMAASAQDTIKIGMINAFSGQFADPAAQLDAGVKLYIQMHGDEVAGKKSKSSARTLAALTHRPQSVWQKS
ncbi:MAG: hypothetical protein ACU0CA_07460 [Paracoccaceae bacterium]